MKHRNRRRSRKIKQRILMGAVLVLALLLGLTIGFLLTREKKEEPVEETETEVETELEESTEETETTEKIEEAKEYPAPVYQFREEEVTVEVEGLEKEYTLAFVNDIHMISDFKAGPVTEESLPTIQQRYDEMFITNDGKGIPSVELWPEIVKYLNHYDFDGVIFAADLLDYSSTTNVQKLKEGMEELKYPLDKMMYLRSDHDYGGWYGGESYTDDDGVKAQEDILGGDSMEQVLDFGDFQVVGINRSHKNISAEQHAFIDKQLDTGKPTIMVTHVPFYSEVDESLLDLSMQVRNKIYYWHPQAPNYVPDGETQGLIDRMYHGDANVVEILGAHIHASWDGQVTDQLREHVFGPCYQGQIGIVHVIPKGGKVTVNIHEGEETEEETESVETEPSVETTEE